MVGLADLGCPQRYSFLTLSAKIIKGNIGKSPRCSILNQNVQLADSQRITQCEIVKLFESSKNVKL